MNILQTETFRMWECKLVDKRARTAIAARVFRLSEGNAGDATPVGEGISEMRIHHGPGFRVYFQRRGTELILLLCGGEKSTQSKDIATAKRLASEWSNK